MNTHNIRSFQGYQPTIDPSVYIDPMCTIIGDVHIGKDSSVWPHVSIRGDMHHIRIGEGTSIQDGSVIHVTHASKYNPDGFATTIGNFVTIGHKVTLHGCTIHDYCIIGMDSIVLDGAVIESQVLLAAGSLVPPKKVLKSGYLWAGRPAQIKRPLTEEELSFFEYSAKNYIKLKDQYLAG
ncbi:MAG: gamma carbonic anhydrase family protein [Candidatus Berkiella sp.]